MVIKDEDGSIVTLTLLKTPISLSDLAYENQKSNKKKVTRVIKQAKTRKRVRKVKLPAPTVEDSKQENLTLLKNPIVLDTVTWGNETFNVKTIQRPCVTGKQRQHAHDAVDTRKRNNALILFEFSSVYPFFYINNTFQCFVCNERFIEPDGLKNHCFNNHNLDELKKQLINRVRNKTLKVDVGALQCKLCSVISPNFHTLKTHLKESHDKDIDLSVQDNIIPFKLGNESHVCQVCNEEFMKLRLLIIHMSRHFNNFSCDVCGTTFITSDMLKKHLQIHEKGTFPCDKCDKTFSSRTKRTLHIRGVHLKRILRRCPMCPATFTSNYQRTKHLRIIHNDNSLLYRCETCGREFDLKYHLTLHIRNVHLQERNHECGICRSRFFTKETLNRHMVTHSGEKNFKCELCGKSYARKKNLNEHSKTHDAEFTDVACSVCGQQCTDHASLAAHIAAFHRNL